MILNADSIEKIIKSANPKEFPDKTFYNSISVKQIMNLSKASGASGREIEILALEHGVVPERYARNMKTFSPQDQVALLKAQVGVVGLGGLGGAVVEILARLGIGTLNVIDGDTFEESNLNRQFLSTPKRIAKSKADTAAWRIKEINPSIAVNHHSQFLNKKNGLDLLNRPDVIVDCLDNVKTRFILERFCRQIGSPLVSAAVAGSTGHVTTIYPQDPGLKLIYGDPDKIPSQGAEAYLGTVPYSVTFLAALECAEVVKIIQHKGSLLRNKLLVADLNEGVFDVINLI
jgi:molybdopterin/thiamine biosynthesis adenylyltransferase